MEQRIQKLFLLLVGLILPLSYGTGIPLQIEGISGNLERNVKAHLSNINIDSNSLDRESQKRINKAIRESLQALGYYSPTINFISTKNNGFDVLKIHIKTGKPIKIAGITVTLQGEARRDTDYQNWIFHERFSLGSILHHSSYEKFKNGFSVLALRKGYFDAEFRETQLGVVPSQYQAYWNINFDSGRRYHFGKVFFHGSHIREDYLRNLIKIKEGEPYSTELLAEINWRLTSTNWFSSIVISPDFSSKKKSNLLPINTVLTPRNSNNLETGIGYASDLGLRIKTVWNKPWLNSLGHSLQTSVSLSKLEQSLDASYKIPVLKDPLEQYFFLKGRFRRKNFNDNQANSTMISIGRYWDAAHGWQRAINLCWSLDYFTESSFHDVTMLIYPRFSINRIRQSGGTVPTWGDSQRYSVDISNTIWKSDIDLFILQAKHTWIRTIAEKHRFLARCNLGWIKTNYFKQLPPSLRFFTTNNNYSIIRGYTYKSLSPHHTHGKLTSAPKIFVGSFEYQYNFANKWWNALFLDSGKTMSDTRQDKFKTGVGIGIRWQSPVGFIRLDIAFPVAIDEYKYKRSAQFYIGFGPEL